MPLGSSRPREPTSPGSRAHRLRCPETRADSVRRLPAIVAAAALLAFLGAVLPARGLQFTDVSSMAGIDISDVTYGAGWADFDGDGAIDLFVSRHYFRPILYANQDNGTFSYSFFPPLFDPADHHGPLLADFDDDGDVDIYLTGGADGGSGDEPKRLYRNDGGFTFHDVAVDWGLGDTLARGRGSSAMDVEGDGDVDVFVAKSARVESPNALFLNDGTTHFTDVAASSGIADSFGSVGGIWGDYDRDGDPDLLIGGEEEPSFQVVLYRNEGNLAFTNVTASALPSVDQISAADWGDYDADGDLDLAIGLGDTGLFDAVTWGADSLTFFFNARNGENGLDGVGFTQTADTAFFDIYYNGFYNPSLISISADAHNPIPTTPFPVPNDAFGAPPFVPGVNLGYFLWVQSTFPVWELRASLPPGAGAFSGIITTTGTFTGVGIVETEPFVPGPRGTRLWRNDGGVFVDVSLASGLGDSRTVHSVTWVDLDQDGRLDLHVVVKGDTEQWNLPDLLYRNEGNGAFTEVAPAWGLTGPTRGLGDVGVFGDCDGDGDLDLALTSGIGARFFARLETHRLLRNDGPVGNWLQLDLEGIWSTREGYGAWVTCVSPTAGRQTRYVAGNAWRGRAAIVEPRFGLGSDASVDSLIVEWPFGGTTVLTDVAANQRVPVVEVHPAVGILADRPAAGPGLRLGVRAEPNPASTTTEFRIVGRGEGTARLEIFGPDGRRVLARGLGPEERSVRWDGRDGNGKAVADGVYFARVLEGDRVATTKVVRVAP